MHLEKIGVLGCGLMGAGIAQTAARAGFPTIVREIDRELLDKGIDRIFAFIDKGIARGKTTVIERRKVSNHLAGAIEMEDLTDCDIIIEAIPENLELKREMFRALDNMVGVDTIFASNTSSLKIADIACASKRKDKFIGTHFFNPVPLMKLVEVVRTEDTSDETFDAVMDFILAIDKVGVACVDTTGFVVNRLLTPYLLDAIRAFEAGIASVEDIDNAVTLGLGYPMGPLTLIDFIGLDTVHHIAGIMTGEFRLSQYESPRLLRLMVEKGWYGKKSKIGFYDYSTEQPTPNDSELKKIIQE
ncbi:MAG: 3-hydroxyacyl-CoA dehydrogenase family protein [candidate division Zixibacteria bacterium]|nr:3-hydroxyacyl-CoA dehydrogenase family protein [Candidatus Tariuqbacter arcticus]